MLLPKDYREDLTGRIREAKANGMPEEAKLLFIGEIQFTVHLGILSAQEGEQLKQLVDQDFASKYAEALEFHTFEQDGRLFS